LDRWFDVQAFRVGLPESRRVAICFSDITERKKAEDEVWRNAEELRASNEELARFNRAMVGRELRMVELKKQVNELCSKLGEPRRFKMDTDGNE
jgi:predicted  nucleic acid-binding Zn-ribbon protein